MTTAYLKKKKGTVIFFVGDTHLQTLQKKFERSNLDVEAISGEEIMKKLSN